MKHVMGLLTAVMILICLSSCERGCRADEPAQRMEQREWLRIGEPGPHGDWHVYGWRRPDGQIGYYWHEQASAPRRSVHGPAPSTGVTNYGVDLSHIGRESIGTFTSNAPTFRPPETGRIASAAHQLQEDMPTMLLAAFGGIVLCGFLVLVAAFFRRSS